VPPLQAERAIGSFDPCGRAGAITAHAGGSGSASGGAQADQPQLCSGAHGGSSAGAADVAGAGWSGNASAAGTAAEFGHALRSHVADTRALLGAGSVPTSLSDQHGRLIAKTNGQVDRFNTELRERHQALALDEQTLDALCARARRAGGLNVVSCCDGKGTLLGILLRRQVPVRTYVSIEKDGNARRVCRVNYTAALGERLVFVHELAQLSAHRLKRLGAWPPHLVFGSTPCADLSGIRRGREKLPLGGAGGPSGSLALVFADKVEQLRRVMGTRPFALIFENVASMLPEARETIGAALQLPAFGSDAAVWEAAHRRRLFWTNLPLAHVPASTRDVQLQDILAPPAVALTTKAACIRSSGSQGFEARAGTTVEIGRRLKMNNLVLCSAFCTDVRGLLMGELASALGLPPNEVDAATGGDAAKRGLLGRSLADGQTAHVLHELIRRLSPAAPAMPPSPVQI
jgi:hypothetical protein